MLSAITKPTELIVDIQLEQCKNPDGTIQIFYRKSDGVLYAVNGSTAKLQDGEAIGGSICPPQANIRVIRAGIICKYNCKCYIEVPQFAIYGETGCDNDCLSRRLQ